ncbi:hypothetical protein AMK26_15045 [Streptomyces sp. CB03234]|uniref:hypothetical protein n=1 Tax=Streptomyces sp. (strain CB03234) TaxID=1703937 RepID=UPI00093DF95B|nr:hypothetical protein [Streptomyces sp. CB03234]OKK04634.1 hypothetical protein AMK26_15045 [Streptomyces sp. CB03234]
MAEPDTVEQHLTGYARILTGARASGRKLTRDELEQPREQGERAAETGIGLRPTAYFDTGCAFRTAVAAARLLDWPAQEL